MILARERLGAFRTLRGLSIYALGDLLEHSASTVSKVLNGHRLPGRELSVAIAKLTSDMPGGPIRPEDWSRDALRPNGQSVRRSRRAPSQPSTPPTERAA